MSNTDNDSSIIYWTQNYLLSWSDFKGDPVSTLPYSASSRVGFQCSYNYESVEANSRIKLKINFLKIRATFSPLLSWVIAERVSEAGSAILLKHEQGHFDLAEEFARKINPTLQTKFQNKTFSIKEKTEDGVEKLMFKIQEKVATESLQTLNRYQNKYDQETKRGRNTDKQSRYNERFDRMRMI